MYKTCPKCGHKRSSKDTGDSDRCPACGLVFSKFLKNLVADDHYEQGAVAQSSSLKPEALSTTTLTKGLTGFFLRRRSDIGKAELIGYMILWLLFLFWGLDFVSMDFQSNEIGRSWFHNVNLVFHEAGHVFFSPFGRTLTILGGSLFQVLLPLSLMFAFLITNKDGFAASLCLWWVGQSIMDLAPYIADASVQRLPLLGGGTGLDSPGAHDWNNLLRLAGWLNYDTRIAAVADILGSGILLMALVWGATMLYIYYKDVMQ